MALRGHPAGHLAFLCGTAWPPDWLGDGESGAASELRTRATPPRLHPLGRSQKPSPGEEGSYFQLQPLEDS